MKKIFIVSSSPRKNGNSDLLAQQFMRGALESGNVVMKKDLRDMQLKFCTGCMSCQNRLCCVIEDCMNALYDDIQSSDVLVFATPIYYYEMSGQLKTFLDRMNPLYYRKNKFKEVYLLASSADSDEKSMDGAVKGIEGWIECFDGVALKGVLRGTGAEKTGDIKATAAFGKAYEMGRSVR